MTERAYSFISRRLPIRRTRESTTIIVGVAHHAVIAVGIADRVARRVLPALPIADIDLNSNIHNVLPVQLVNIHTQDIAHTVRIAAVNKPAGCIDIQNG